MQTRVVLDANAYLDANYGRSEKFRSLLDFLRKTNARLVLLPSVLNEVLANHERALKTTSDAAKKSVKEAARHCFTEKEPRLFLANPDFVIEAEALKRSMLNVGKSVAVEYFEDCSGVDILEIARRGAKRIPPANSNGEELRDVIHWLAILSYAKQNDARILFVSRDNGFWCKDGNVRPEILLDIDQTHRRIDLFRDIDDLLKKNSLSATPLDTTSGVALFDISQVAATIVEVVGNSLNALDFDDSTVEFKSGTLVASEFQTGMRYQVSANSEFVEATFRVKVSAQIEFRPNPPMSAYYDLGRNVLQRRQVTLSGLAGIRRPAEAFDVVALADLSTRVVDQQVGLPEVERVRLDRKNTAQG